MRGYISGENKQDIFTASEKSVHTYLATCAFVIEGAESDGGEEDGNVEEDGCGHVLQQGFITANYA